MITVNGTVIPDPQIAREAQYHPASSREEALHQAAVALVVRTLLLQEAAARGISDAAEPDSATPEERAIAALLDQQIRLPAAEEHLLQSFYESHRESLRSPDLFEASHILFAAGLDQPEERLRARAAAEATLEDLKRDPGAFERLAAERSADQQSRRQGGHLGQITRGQTTPELEACLDSLAPGEMCRQPVETRHGWHVVRLDRAVRGRPLPYELARERVSEYVSARAWTDAVHQFIHTLADKAAITGIEL